MKNLGKIDILIKKEEKFLSDSRVTPRLEAGMQKCGRIWDGCQAGLHGLSG